MAALVVLHRMSRPRPRPRPRHRPPRPCAQPNTLSVDTNKPDNVRICRVCLKEGDIPIFDQKMGDIAESINKIGGVELSKEDDFPKALCGECYNLLQAAIKFRKRIQNADCILRELKPRIECFNIDAADSTTWNDVDDKNEQEFEQKKVDCRKCKIEFSNMDELLEHRQSESHTSRRVKCKECQAECARSYLDVHMTKYHGTMQPYVCDVCGRTFAVKGSFERHILIHTDKLPFKCSDCPYRCRLKESLKMHIRVHTGEKPYVCEQCPARFLSASNLKKHSRTHQTDFDYKCDECNRGFFTLTKLQEHFRIDHTGLREHKCHVCGKEFAYRKQMLKHSRNVHHQSGRLPLYLQYDKKLEEKRSYVQGGSVA